MRHQTARQGAKAGASESATLGTAKVAAEPKEGEAGSTDRMLVLSDGIFAIAITLLVLDLKVPEGTENSGAATVTAVAAGLLAQWPRFCGYLLSFINIGVMWNNHVTMFRYIRRADHVLTMLNLLLLLCLSINPFITALLASYLLLSPAHRQVATTVYSGVWLVTTIPFNIMWFYAAKDQRLLDHRVSTAHYADITRRYRWGPAVYLVLFLLAVAGQPTLCLILSACLTLVYALPYNASSLREDAEILEATAERRLAARLFRRR